MKLKVLQYSVAEFKDELPLSVLRKMGDCDKSDLEGGVLEGMLEASQRGAAGYYFIVCAHVCLSIIWQDVVSCHCKSLWIKSAC